MTPLFEFSLFVNQVADDYKDLKPIYEKYVLMPECLSRVAERLRVRTDVIPFYYVGDAIGHLCLIAENCRFFNR